MPFNASGAERFSPTPHKETVQPSYPRVIDMSPPNAGESERSVDYDAKNDEMLSLANIANARVKLISALFENGTKTQNTALAIELIEEARFWMEDLEKQIEFIQEYRSEEDSEEAFSQAATATVSAMNALRSELDHMHEVVRIWHEDEHGESSTSENVPEETEGAFAEVADEELITDEPEPVDQEAKSETRIKAHRIVDVSRSMAHPAFEKPIDRDADAEEIIPPSLYATEASNDNSVTAPLIEIPGSLEETREKCAAIYRRVREIERNFNQRKPAYAERERFDDYLIELSREYGAFEERLDLLNRAQTPDILEEKAIIAEAMHKIQDIRSRIHKIEFSKTAQEDFEYHLHCKTVKKEKLERILDKLTKAIARKGIEEPELYMAEQASGLGTIRRGLMSLLGRKEEPVGKVMLGKLRNEAVAAEESYFKDAYDFYQKHSLPAYDQARKKSLLLQLNENSDAYELWHALSAEIEELGGQNLEAPVNRHERDQAIDPSPKRMIEEQPFPKEVIRTQQRDALEIRQEELDTIKESGLRNVLPLLEAIKKDEQANELTFRPIDYIAAIGALKRANNQKDIRQIKELLPNAQSMRDEIDSLWIDTTNPEGQPVYDDQAVLVRASKILEESGRKKRR